MLEVNQLVAGYGSIPVLQDVSFSIKPGEILLIGGENGAGKSTLMRVLAGFIKPTSGSILFEGNSIANLAPEQVAQNGLRLVLDGHRVFPELSVYDNLRLGVAGLPHVRSSFQQMVTQIFDLFPNLAEKRDALAHDLSGGQQQILALAQAFVAGPKLLLCDEPSLGVAQALLPPILSFLKDWAQQGTAIVIVDQHIKIAAPYADNALIMQRGEIVLRCEADQLDSKMADFHKSRQNSYVHA
ncbi:ABC transporter ATP-binding protein [Pseudovibrio sp. Ad26]|uniref:ABC transporter ATP-binding protein n=1 Tax=Pseudovibrio sp. Ad26 TaxID=989410 RepID=UPI0007AE3A6C|nr:ABC transporter ATP-binding protein [Pseudovibrio sp. Ad26]KZL15207.1 High-affinity branched-chain amino acid transport ATP-binding protein LivF [Pseudovibrio sp. Ad26]